jgi:large subunit ribosomal protein L30
MKKLKVTLIKSPIKSKPVTKTNVRALGLRKLNASRIHDDTPVIRGMITKARHLLKVEDVK